MIGKLVKSTPGTRELTERLFRWTEAGGLVVLPTPEAPGNTYVGLRITEDGMRIHSLVVRQPPWGSLEPAPPPQLMRWSAERGFEFLAAAPTGWQLTDLVASGDGEVLAGTGFEPGIGRVGYRWTQASGLQTVPGLVSIGAVSREGGVVAGLAKVGRPESTPTSLGWCRFPAPTENLGAPRHADDSPIETLSWSVGLNGTGTQLLCCCAETNALYRWSRSEPGFQVLGRIPEFRMGAVLAVAFDGTVAVGWGQRFDPHWGEWISLGWIWRQTRGLQTLPEWLAEKGLPTPEPGTGPIRSISDDASIILGSGPSGGPFSLLPKARGWLLNMDGTGQEPLSQSVPFTHHPALALEFQTTAWSRPIVERSTDLIQWTRTGENTLGDGSPQQHSLRINESPASFLRVRPDPQ